MSKPKSGLFKGTKGYDDFYGDAEKVIAERVKGLDLTPHPIVRKQLSSKQKAQIKVKIKMRTATKKEYEHYEWNRRLDQRRKAGIDALSGKTKKNFLSWEINLPGTGTQNKSKLYLKKENHHLTTKQCNHITRIVFHNIRILPILKALYILQHRTNI